MLSKQMCVIHPVVSVFTLTWFIRYIHYSLHNVIMNKTKVLSPQVPPPPPQAKVELADHWLSCLGPLVLLLPQPVFGFPIS